MVREMNRCALLLASLSIVGCGDCGGDLKPPGGEVLGTYELTSKGIFAACSLPGFPVNYVFSGTFSRETDGGKVYFSSGTEQFKASFDGQFASYGRTQVVGIGLADGGNCNLCEMKQVESATLALLSGSQSKAVGDVCPTTALDGGVPATDEDAGIAPPGIGSDGGFDAVLACGELVVQITGEGFCDPACYSCKLQYRVSGPRTK
jgi:hypothetical protein